MSKKLTAQELQNKITLLQKTKGNIESNIWHAQKQLLKRYGKENIIKNIKPENLNNQTTITFKITVTPPQKNKIFEIDELEFRKKVMIYIKKLLK